MALYSKSKVADYIYCHSRFLHSCLVQCEELYQHEMGFSCMMVLFNCLENISRSAINDYTLLESSRNSHLGVRMKTWTK